MSLAEACGWTLLRSLVIALAALPVCFAIRRQLFAARGWRRTLLWTAVLIPLFVPDMLVGYAYYNFALSLIHHPVWNEFFYAALVFFKVLPVGAVIAAYTPAPPISPQALHCRRLAMEAGTSRWAQLRILSGYLIRGSARAALPAGALMFLLAFQEFELVSLVNATSWTIWLFDQQAQGLPLSAALRYDLLPTVIQVALIAAVLPLAFTGRRAAGRRDVAAEYVPPARRFGLWAVVCGGVVLMCVIPVVMVGGGTVTGTAVLTRNPRLFREIAVGMGLALAAALPAYAAATWLLPSPQGARWPRARAVLATLLSLPGLLGGLTLGLAMLAAFQSAPLADWYDTPLPWWMALWLFLLPRAMLLQLLLAAARREEPLHLARLLADSPDIQQRRRGRRLSWRLRFRGHYWAVVVLVWWGYLDPTLASLLRPSGLDPAPMRLYNFMHYGQTGGLSAMLAATIAIPLLLLPTAALLRRVSIPWPARWGDPER